MTERQKRFVEEYMIDLNATQAAIRAGFSPKTANEQGCRLLANVSVRTAIDKALAERSKRTGINADRVLRELAKIAFANAADVADFDEATVKEGTSRDDTAAIQSVRVKKIPTEDGDIVEREIKLYDKKAALELLGKHLGMFKENVNLMGSLAVKIVDDIGADDDND